MSRNLILVFIFAISTIHASRILYFPLPKIHSSEKKSTSDEFIPLSAMHKKQSGREKQDNFELKAWLDKEAEAKRLTDIDEFLSENYNDFDDRPSLDRETRKPLGKKIYDNDVVKAVDDANGDLAINEPWPADTADSKIEHLQSDTTVDNTDRRKRRNDDLFLVIVATCSLVGILGLIAAAIFWYKIQKKAESALDAEYPSYGVTGPGSNGSKISSSTTMSDRKLAQSAQMFHYQQQRQQMMAQEKAHLDEKPVHSDDSDDETPNGGDYTVYECPGLAPTGEMEVRNPLFTEPDSTLTSTAPASHPTINNHYPQPTTTTPSSSPPKEKSLS